MSSIPMRGADLVGVDFADADLTNTDLSRADLEQANLSGANLGCANLADANLHTTLLEGAVFNSQTVLPDGSYWTPETDLSRFTDPGHPNFWRSDDPNVAAFYGFDAAWRLSIPMLIELLITAVNLLHSPFESGESHKWIDRRQQLAQALIAKGEAAVSPLLETLKHLKEKWQQRKQAISIRSSYYPYELSTYRSIRGLILHILGAIGGAKATDFLVQTLLAEDTDVPNRREAALALDRIGTSEASDLVKQWRHDHNVSDRDWLQEKLTVFFLISDTDPALLGRIDEMARQKNVDRKRVAETLLIHLNAHSGIEFVFGQDLPEFAKDEFAYLLDETVEAVDAEIAKADVIRQLVRQHVQSDHQAALQTLDEMRTRGWLEDGSLRGIDPRLLAITELDDLSKLGDILLPGADFGGADLTGFSFPGALLRQANFTRANLKGVDFTRANLQEADLTESNLNRAILYGTDLTGANLARADLARSDLSTTNVQSANLNAANLKDAKLWQVSYDERTVLPDGSKWTPETDMKRFTDPDRPEFWRPAPGSVWWYPAPSEVEDS